MTKSTKRTRGGQPGNKNSAQHDHYGRERALKERGLAAINLRTSEGQIAFEIAERIAVDISGGEKYADTTLPAKTRREQLNRLLDPVPEGKRLALKLITGIAWDVGDIEKWKEKQRGKNGTIVNQRSKSLPPVVLQEYKAIETISKLLDKIYDGPIWKRRPPPAKTLEQILNEGEEPEAP